MTEATKYVRRPYYVHVIQWNGGKEHAQTIIDWATENGGSAEYVEVVYGEGLPEDLQDQHEFMRIHGMTGMWVANKDDFVILADDGDFSVLTPSDFHVEFQAVQLPFQDGEGLFV